MIVGCGPKSKEWEIHSTLAELERLAHTSRVETVARIVQFRDRKDPSWLIGKGKAEEIARLAEEKAVDLAIFDQELSPAQVRNLEQILPCKVIDRTQLILDIFAQRAQTKEGRLQVELAQLQYLLPRLAGRGKELSRLGGGIGTRGPGEKKLETDRRHIGRQIRQLKRELEEVKKHRQLHQARRRKLDWLQVALVGYTNAGKSTLLNRLTGAGVLVENQLFATLDPTSRALQLPSGREVLLTDTVGFIRKLPHDLVAAFRSTLEQVNEADLLLHVVDSSHPEALEQMEAVEEVLNDLGAAHIPVLTVFNKADKADSRWPDAPGDHVIQVSAFNDMDIARLKQEIEQALEREQIEGKAEIPVERGDWISALYDSAEILSSRITELTIEIKFCLPLKNYQRLSPELKACIQSQPLARRL
ncbi:GTPase HflX [Paenactinomyces guangxiensis]|uniref:GTPase HflX n=2 Tax=Paenactinomyces guangxiensis TaxID=1490290 RepID=A0A7W1WQZ3_9BACL|nr:GTPase HflX [Paenactinomyces guangxiensis]MBA4494445.1 GTPase HflX [Paenactinomyces guangxiensis]MBH8591500.1 GTPase HflX [Paenactinomyces guangxiensis]